MKLKLFFLLFVMTFLTGCDITYKLEFVDNTFKEDVVIKNIDKFKEEVESVYAFDLSTNYLDVSDYTKEEGLSFGYTYYTKKLITDPILQLEYKYDFNKNEYDNTQIGRMVFPDMKFSANTLESGKINDIYDKYLELNNINIEISTDKEVSYNNADKVIDNIYYWEINRENSYNKDIKIIFAEEENIISLSNSKQKSNILYIILGVIGIGFLISIVVIYEKVKNSNK